MSDQLIVEREGLEKKDKTELQAIVEALGGSPSSRMRKSDLIDQILDLSGATAAAAERGDVDGADESAGAESADGGKDADEAGDDDSSDAASGTDAGGDKADDDDDKADDDDDDEHPLGPDGEPLADWEVQVQQEIDTPATGRRKQNGRGRSGADRQADGGGRTRTRKQDDAKETDRGSGRGDKKKEADRAAAKNGDKGGDRNNDKNNDKKGADKSDGENQDKRGDDDEVESHNRRSRRRRGRGRDRDDAGNEPVSEDPIKVEGFLDLRDEGYAFLRVNGYLPSRDDAYVSVKQVRQYELRKGDHLTGTSRPASRNEKNPALQQVEAINGQDPENYGERTRFDRLTPLFPSEHMAMEIDGDEDNMLGRLIDLVAPVGKGQRLLIESPPRSGKTTVIRELARSIETNHPDVALLVLLVDERPEEVTEMQRYLQRGEVVSSNFDRPPDEHLAVSELTLERTKRMVEDGRDVVLLVDGITRLARAYNMAGPQSGRLLQGGVDGGALYPPKRFLGAARNLEEGGSLTVVATAMVDTGSPIDEVIFDELRPTANAELRLDGALAEQRIYPAVDLAYSATRNEDALLEPAEVAAAAELRRVAAEAEEADGARPGAGMAAALKRLSSFTNNAEFVAEISKSRSV